MYPLHRVQVLLSTADVQVLLSIVSTSSERASTRSSAGGAMTLFPVAASDHQRHDSPSRRDTGAHCRCRRYEPSLLPTSTIPSLHSAH